MHRLETMARWFGRVAGVVALVAAEPTAAQIPVFEEAPPPAGDLGYTRLASRQRATGRLEAVALFARFGPGPGGTDTPPPFAARLFDGQPGSLTHYFDAMSFGRLQFQGTVLPAVYTSRYGSSAYLSQTGEGRYGRFVQEVLRQADTQVDFGRFDNDGADGEPNSGDDDGVVDYVFVVLSSAPRGFIRGGATGTAGLGFNEPVETGDTGADGTPITISGSTIKGSVVGAGPSQAMGMMAHEFGHALGLNDLYDLKSTSPEENSAGIGVWGLMGRGAIGWNGDDGPVPFSAFYRERLGWLGPDDDRLVEVRGDTSLVLQDLDLGGSLVYLPIHTTVDRSGKVLEEYLFLEHRVRRGQHYDRNLPAEGVLVWHYRPQAKRNNNDERAKMLDVVCADGLFADHGYPLGKQPDPHTGRDNLDFWDYDEGYRRDHAGNLGDTTDVFDGVTRTRLDIASNPSSAIGGRGLTASSGLRLTFERDGEDMRVDIRRPRWSGVIDGEALWFEDVFVEDDLVISPNGHLRVYRGTRARFAPGTELVVEGGLQVPDRAPRQQDESGYKYYSDAVVMEAAVEGASWRGLRQAGGGVIELAEDAVVIRDTLSALPGEPRPTDDVATAVFEEESAAAVDFSLGLAFPNPFDGATRIPYSMAETADARLDIYNSLGQRVATPLDETVYEGSHEVEWRARDEDGRAVAGGVYLYQLTVPERFSGRGKMLFLGGMSNLIGVEEELRRRQRDWGRLATELVPVSGTLGYARTPTGASAAYDVGRSTGLLRIMAVDDRSPATAAAAARRLSQALRALGAPEAASQGAEALAEALATEALDPAGLRAALQRVDRSVQSAVVESGTQAQTLFHIGVWLQHLRAAAVAALELGQPLQAYADPAQNASLARAFALELEGPNAAALEEVARATEAAPADVRMLRVLLRRIEALEEGLAP